MKWFKRKKKPSKLILNETRLFRPTSCQTSHKAPAPNNIFGQVPPQILTIIFYFVCPHTLDDSYESCEKSTLADACMLCDLRDLAHCAQVCNNWRKIVRNVLYRSIRIDQVHYCELEAILAERRKQRSFMSRNSDPEDPSHTRLRLLCRTLRNDKLGIALHVQFLKIPYMTRETCKSDLARTISVLPNLRYVDLPDGVFTDEVSCENLRLEIQARCPELRKMSYLRGAERNLERLIEKTIWRNLEVMELSRLDCDPTLFRHALACLPHLRALKVSDMDSFNDKVLARSEILPPIPALAELILENVPLLTAEGLVSFLSEPHAQQSLKSLSLTTTGVLPAALQSILALAPKIEHLSIKESMSSALPAGIPLLKSFSLHTLNFEITAATTTAKFTDSTVSHYNYLRSSIMSNGLPNLNELYVLDPSFSETLVNLRPPRPGFAFPSDSLQPLDVRKSASYSVSPEWAPYNSTNPFVSTSSPSESAFSSPAPLLFQSQAQPSRTLEIYSKGLDEMEWNFSRIPTGSCNTHRRRGSAAIQRPTSTYGLSEQAELGWSGAGNDVRKSVIIGNGAQGFMNIPGLPAEIGRPVVRPVSSAGERMRSNLNYGKIY